MHAHLNGLKTAALLGLLSAIILLVGAQFGSGGLLVALLVALGVNGWSWFHSDTLALRSMRAYPVSQVQAPQLYAVVGALASSMRMPMPRVYVSPEASPNAFATGRSPRHAAVCATEGLLRLLNRNEVAGVMAHELAHVKHRDILIQSVAATVGGAISYLGYMFMFGGGSSSDDDGESSHPLAGLLVLLLGPLAAGVIQMAISRSREYNADTAGAEICGNPMYLASALEKIHAYAHQIPMNVNPAFNSLMIAEPRNVMGTVAGLFQTHPPLEKRLMNLIGRETTGMYRYAA